jgi:hypothetical protein
MESCLKRSEANVLFVLFLTNSFKAVNLLNDYPQHLRPNDVIPLLPPTMSIGKLESYFERSLRELQSSLRRGQVEKQLRKKDLLDAQLTRAKLTGRRVVIQPNTKCKVCKGAIGEVRRGEKRKKPQVFSEESFLRRR